MRDWDWDGMAEANRGRLLRLLVGLFGLLGSGSTVRRVVWRKILARLVPMESAVRRLIFVLARDLDLPPVQGGGGTGATRGAAGGAARGAAFVLVDRLRNVDPKPRRCPTRFEPRVSFLDEAVARDRVPEPADDDPMDAAALRRRLDALEKALGDLPAQARRLVRWQQRNERARAAGHRRRMYPFRTGRPPGHRERGRREADKVLADCHDLALRCLAMLDGERREA